MNQINLRRFSPIPRGHAIIVALLAGLTLSACGGPDDASNERATTRDQATDSRGTRISITFGGTHITAQLLDTPTAHDLAAQLPLALSFRDHNHVEKTAPLPRKLSLKNAPTGHDPAAGDIGYWAPDGDVVLYYDDRAPYFDGIVRIGKFHGDLAAIAHLPDGASATIAAEKSGTP